MQLINAILNGIQLLQERCDFRKQLNLPDATAKMRAVEGIGFALETQLDIYDDFVADDDMAELPQVYLR